VTQDGERFLWREEDGGSVVRLRGPADRVVWERKVTGTSHLSAGLFASGRLAVISTDGGVEVLGIEKGRSLGGVRGVGRTYHPVALSPDERTLVLLRHRERGGDEVVRGYDWDGLLVERATGVVRHEFPRGTEFQ